MSCMIWLASQSFESLPLEEMMNLKATLIAAGFALSLCIPATCTVANAQAPAGAPAGSTGVCNDGSYSSSANKSGACRGHKGVKTWFVADAKASKSAPAPAAAPSSAPAPAPAPAAAVAPKPAPATAPAATPTAKTASAAKTKGTPAPGGGPGLVWLNTNSNVYHCQGDADYGTTKAGKYLTEPAAKAAGGRASHGKACS